MWREIKTYERSDYIFLQAPDGTFKFKVRAPREAYIALLNKPAELEPIYEIRLGTANNQMSTIRKNFTENLVEADTPDLLSAGRMRHFWICWQNNAIVVGRGNDSFMSHDLTEDEIFDVYYIGIRVGENERGTWMLETDSHFSGPGFWVAASGGTVPEFAMDAGYDKEKLYIARAKHASDLLPGYLVPSKGVCLVSHGGGAFKYSDYEVFCKSGGEWKPASDGEIPPHAIKAGQTQDGERLYLGRVQHNDATLLGKVQQTHACCYIPYEDTEISFTNYEVFVYESFGMMELKR